MTTTLQRAPEGTGKQEQGAQAPREKRNRQARPEKLKGRGRLVPAQATGVEYPVAFGIYSAPAVPQYGRVSQPTRWAKCSIRSVGSRVFPDGYYFLHTDEGKIHQLKVIGGVWHCLALAA